MNVTIDDAQRAELLAAVMDRKAAIAKHVKDLTKDAMPEEAELAERRLSLYSTDGTRVGLVAMFALQPDLDEERVKRGEVRDADGQQDIFGGGAATGGGHPAGERQWLDGRGNPHASEAEAEAADAAQRELDENANTDGGTAENVDDEPPRVLEFRAIGAGDASAPVDVEYEIVHAGADVRCVHCNRTKAEHYGEGLACQPGGSDVYAPGEASAPAAPALNPNGVPIGVTAGDPHVGCDVGGGTWQYDDESEAWYCTACDADADTEELAATLPVETTPAV